ncbi:MAG: hypothetical protein JO149_02325 [Gammaproteobacteria bacterium]|nr:hypothetical protein [Gammaproteobacteria bacterium]
MLTDRDELSHEKQREFINHLVFFLDDLNNGAKKTHTNKKLIELHDEFFFNLKQEIRHIELQLPTEISTRMAFSETILSKVNYAIYYSIDENEREKLIGIIHQIEECIKDFANDQVTITNDLSEYHADHVPEEQIALPKSLTAPKILNKFFNKSHLSHHHHEEKKAVSMPPSPKKIENKAGEIIKNFFTKTVAKKRLDFNFDSMVVTPSLINSNDNDRAEMARSSSDESVGLIKFSKKK